jgi:hypothetical protein
MTKTIKERYIEAIYKQHPKLKQLDIAVEAMVDWYMADEKGFRKAMKRFEAEEAKRPVPRKSTGEIIIECIGKKHANQEDTVFDGSQQQKIGGPNVQLLTDDTGLVCGSRPGEGEAETLVAAFHDPVQLVSDQHGSHVCDDQSDNRRDNVDDDRPRDV